MTNSTCDKRTHVNNVNQSVVLDDTGLDMIRDLSIKDLSTATDNLESELYAIERANKQVSFGRSNDDHSIRSNCSEGSENDDRVGEKENGVRHNGDGSNSSTFKYKAQPPVKYRKKKQNSAQKNNSNRLTKCSEMYDMDGDGVLNEIEQSMRNRDMGGRGYLTNEEVYQIVQEQLEAKNNAKFLKKAIAGLACFTIVLGLSNFATSWASAILAQDTQADSDSSTMLLKGTNEVLGFQSAGDTFELVPMEPEERRSRRAMVLMALEANPDDEIHAHRMLKKNKKNKKNKIVTREVAFDNGKCSERDLAVLKAKCDGSRTVNIKRTWRDGSSDLDNLCRPGVLMTVKGPKKCDESCSTQYTFSHPDENKDAVFTCEGGECYTSGGLFDQGPGEPCDLTVGSDDCEAGLHCHASGNLQGTDTGVCVALGVNQKEYQPCDPSLGTNACQGNLYCAASSDPLITTGICTSYAVNPNDGSLAVSIPKRQKEGKVCDLSLGSDACKRGLYCYSGNRSLRSSVTTGICTATVGVVKEDPFDLPGDGETCYVADGARACASPYTCLSTYGTTGICGIYVSPKDSVDVDFIQKGPNDVGYTVSIPNRQKEGDVCDVSLGDDACKPGLLCARTSSGTATGICVASLGVVKEDPLVLPGKGDTCYFADGTSACSSPYQCLRTAGSSGAIGICEVYVVQNDPVDVDFIQGNQGNDAQQDPLRLPGEGEICYFADGQSACASPYFCVSSSGLGGATGRCSLGSVRDSALPTEGESCLVADGSNACAAPYSCLNSDGTVGGAGAGGSGVGVGADAGYGVTIAGPSGIIVTGNGGASGAGAGGGGSGTGYCGVPSARSSGGSGGGASASMGAVISGPSGTISTGNGGSGSSGSGYRSGGGSGPSSYSSGGAGSRGDASAFSGAATSGSSGAISSSNGGAYAGYGQYCEYNLGSSACANGYACRSVGINGSDRYTCQ